jgi:hypothetical protein
MKGPAQGAHVKICGFLAQCHLHSHAPTPNMELITPHDEIRLS